MWKPLVWFLFWLCFTALKFQRDSTGVFLAFLGNCRQRDFLSLFRIGHLYSVYLDILSVPRGLQKTTNSVQGTLPFNTSQLFKFDRKFCVDSQGIGRVLKSFNAVSTLCVCKMRSKKVECLAQGNSEWMIRELGDLSAFHYSKKHFPTSPKFWKYLGITVLWPKCKEKWEQL